MKDFLVLLLYALVFVFIVMVGVDLEIARRDYVRNGYATGCLFRFNCKGE